MADPAAGTGGAAANGYGWLGAKQRSTAETGILLMGARLYNPATGLFTSLDPVYGGNDTPYTYPNDPINRIDTTGEWGWLRKVGRVLWKYKWDIVLTAAGFVPVTGGAVWAMRIARLVRFARSAKAGNHTIRASQATTSIAGRMWVGRGATVGRAKNGSRMLTSVKHRGPISKSGSQITGRAYRSASKSGRGVKKTNLTYSQKGRHDYVNIHVEHGRRWRR